MAKFRRRAGWITIFLLCLMGMLIYFCIPGFSFSAYVFFGIAGVVLCFRLLAILRDHRRSLGKALTLIFAIALTFGLGAALFTGIVIAKAAVAVPAVSCRYVIVLGAGVNGTVPSLSLRERLDAAYDYMRANPEAICVVSGGQGRGEDITEALCMYNDLTGKGIAPERVWMEDKATNTRENIAYSLALIEEKTGRRPDTTGLISSEYHLFRAGLFAREQNLTAVGIPAKTSWFSLRLNYFLREIVAVWYYCLLGG